MASVFTINEISYNIDISGSLTESSYREDISKQYIKKIFIGANVTSIGQGAFQSATILEEVEFDISCNLTTVEDNVFSSCSQLKTVYNIPNIFNWGNSMFQECSSLTTVTFSPLFKNANIKNWTFLACSSLTEITFPASVTIIKSYAFSDCTRLKK